MTYDSRQDTKDHIQKVREVIAEIVARIEVRGWLHDESKLEEPEKSMYDKYKPMLQDVELKFGYGSLQYEALVKELDSTFVHHFQKNRHHPEHFPNGINDMTLIDLVEMFCDWKAAAARYGRPPNIEANKKRFGISDQLAQILQNTLDEMER